MRYDIVGCGAAVQRYHLPALRTLCDGSELSIAGCYDPDVVQAEQLASQLGADRAGPVATPRRGDGVDAVLVAAPPRVHAEIAALYMEAGKSVFCEKPFTRTAAEARSLVSTARRLGVQIAVNHFWRFYPAASAARSWLRTQNVPIDAVEASEGARLGAWKPASDYLLDDPHGGVTLDYGSHVADLALYVLGLDTAQIEPGFRIDRISKQPTSEPTDECRARVTLTVDGAEIGVDILVSRLRVVARGLKVRGAFGVLFVPAGFARRPILFSNGDAFRIEQVDAPETPMDLEGCFLLAHREFLAAIASDERSTRISGERFLLLGELLESLHGAGGA